MLHTGMSLQWARMVSAVPPREITASMSLFRCSSMALSPSSRFPMWISSSTSLRWAAMFVIRWNIPS